MLIQKEEELERLKGRGVNPDEIKKQLEEAQKEKEEDKLSVDYIRNVFVKYLEYQAGQDEKMAKTMEKVLFTVLRAGEDDLEKVAQARAKNTGGIWGYFASSGDVPKPVSMSSRVQSPIVRRGSASVTPTSIAGES